VETGAARGNPVKDACGDFLFDGFPPPAWKSRKNAGFSTVPTAPAINKHYGIIERESFFSGG
jgi:hypothetical protein